MDGMVPALASTLVPLDGSGSWRGVRSFVLQGRHQSWQEHHGSTFFFSGDLLVRLMCSDAMVHTNQEETNEDGKCNRPKSGFFTHGLSILGDS